MSTQTNDARNTNGGTPVVDATAGAEGANPDREQAISQITDFIIKNETWMLTTCGSDHVIRSRPMLNVNDKFDGDLYLFANKGEALIRSINENPQCNIVISEPGNSRYASITGKATRIEDLKKLELLWSDRCQKWFGSETPNESVTVIRFDVDSAEYWDASQNIIGRIGNFFSGTSMPSMESVEHSVVKWRQGVSPSTGLLGR